MTTIVDLFVACPDPLIYRFVLFVSGDPALLYFFTMVSVVSMYSTRPSGTG
jgi:hypothetical protein